MNDEAVSISFLISELDIRPARISEEISSRRLEVVRFDDEILKVLVSNSSARNVFWAEYAKYNFKKSRDIKNTSSQITIGTVGGLAGAASYDAAKYVSKNVIEHMKPSHQLKVEKHDKSKGKYNHRPYQLDGFLSEPVIDVGHDPSYSYPGWDLDHFSNSRFYISGAHRALIEFNVTANFIRRFSTEASDAIRIMEFLWPYSKYIPSTISPVILSKVLHGEPVTFLKAMHIIISMELAIKNRIYSGKNTANSEFELYRYARIFPACSYIEGLNSRELYEIQKSGPKEISRMVKYTGIRSEKCLNDMAMGHTVSRHTANRVLIYIQDNFKNLEKSMGAVRSKPSANQYIGRSLPASLEEYIPMHTV